MDYDEWYAGFTVNCLTFWILEYILLENVVGHYKYPCILDLKMGTEKHKDYVVSKEEADRRQARWDQTTSRSLGVRVCGMKVSLLFSVSQSL